MSTPGGGASRDRGPVRSPGASRDPGATVGDDDPLLGQPGGDYDQRRPLDARDFSRRTLLANERTYLAWWRTGLTTLTVALAGARVVPELSGSGTRWPYTALGVVFALLGVVCMVYAEQRRRAVAAAVRRGAFVDADARLTLALSLVGALAGVATVLLILFDT